MKTRNWISTALLLGCAPFLSSAQTPSSAPLESPTVLAQIVDRAITSNPEMNAGYQDFVSALEGTNIARAQWRPQVTGQAWTGREWRSHLHDQPSYDWARHGWNVELRQLVFDGGATSNRIAQFGFEHLAKYYDLQATSNKLANEAVAAYLDVQRYRSMQELAKENFIVHQSTLKQISEREQSGVGRGVDMVQASGRLALAQTNLMTESNNLNDVMQRYRRIVGEFPPQEMPEVSSVQEGLPVIGVTSSFEDALRANPSLLSKQALAQAAQAGEKVAKSTLYSPVVDVRASVGRDREQPGAAFRDNQAARIQLMLTYPIFRGGGDAARVRQTAAQNYAAQDVRDYTCRNVQQELAVAWNNIVRMRQQLPFLREHELSTSKARLAYTQQFGIGERSLLDLLDTENELFDARRALLNAEFDLKKVEYYWLSLANRVIPSLGLSQPYSDQAPDAEQALQLPDEQLKACLEDLPNTSNLQPIALN